MHASPHQNVFGVTTHYGTHPDPPRLWATRMRHAAATTLTVAVAAAIAARRAVVALRSAD